jgi:hypothetical protein
LSLQIVPLHIVGRPFVTRTAGNIPTMMADKWFQAKIAIRHMDAKDGSFKNYRG